METDRDIPQTMMDGSAHYPPCSDFTLVQFSSAVILLERFRDAIRCRRGGVTKLIPLMQSNTKLKQIIEPLLILHSVLLSGSLGNTHISVMNYTLCLKRKEGTL